jgi:hypothetical protein
MASRVARGVKEEEGPVTKEVMSMELADFKALILAEGDFSDRSVSGLCVRSRGLEDHHVMGHVLDVALIYVRIRN